jgi:hypothetical protein
MRLRSSSKVGIMAKQIRAATRHVLLQLIPRPAFRNWEHASSVPRENYYNIADFEELVKHFVRDYLVAIYLNL